jgi:hypothetical protein
MRARPGQQSMSCASDAALISFGLPQVDGPPPAYLVAQPGKPRDRGQLWNVQRTPNRCGGIWSRSRITAREGSLQYHAESLRAFVACGAWHSIRSRARCGELGLARCGESEWSANDRQDAWASTLTSEICFWHPAIVNCCSCVCSAPRFAGRRERRRLPRMRSSTVDSPRRR